MFLKKTKDFESRIDQYVKEACANLDLVITKTRNGIKIQLVNSTGVALFEWPEKEFRDGDTVTISGLKPQISIEMSDA